MFRPAVVLCAFATHAASTPCSVRELDKMSSALHWMVAYPDADSEAATGLPVLNTYVTPKYSKAACEAHWKGVITAEIIITETGLPTDLTVMNDPGFEMGDGVKQTLRSWRFSPATRDGRPISSDATAEFGFDSPAGHLTPPTPVLRYDPTAPAQRLSRGQPRQLVLMLVVDPKGLPHNIRVARSVGGAWDQAGIAAVRNWRFSPGTLDGRPVAMETTIAVTF